jgi:hypothetical protein
MRMSFTYARIFVPQTCFITPPSIKKGTEMAYVQYNGGRLSSESFIDQHDTLFVFLLVSDNDVDTDTGDTCNGGATATLSCIRDIVNNGLDNNDDDDGVVIPSLSLLVMTTLTWGTESLLLLLLFSFIFRLSLPPMIVLLLTAFVGDDDDDDD